MSKQRLQELAGIKINELEINNPNKLFSWVSEYELCYDKEDLINYYDKEDENVSFSSELSDVGYEDEDILESSESLEQTMSYLEDNEDASTTIDQYITFKNDLEKRNIPYNISYFGDGGSVYIDLQIKFNDIKNFIKNE